MEAIFSLIDFLHWLQYALWSLVDTCTNIALEAIRHW